MTYVVAVEYYWMDCQLYGFRNFRDAVEYAYHPVSAGAKTRLTTFRGGKEVSTLDEAAIKKAYLDYMD